jgi:hypothetical protein
MLKPIAGTLEAVEAALIATRGILDVKWLGPGELRQVHELEEALEKEGRGLAGVCCNTGVKEVLQRAQVCVVLNNNEFRHASEPALAWVVGDLILGEEISDRSKLEAILQSTKVKLLGTNFVVYFDRMRKARGCQPSFVVRGLAFPEIEGVTGVHRVISASPSKSADLFLKQRYDWNASVAEEGTILIGFDLDQTSLRG